jgi:hypothetical protein
MAGHRARLVLVAVLSCAACAGTPKPAPRASRPPPAAAGEAEIPPRPADADADVAYYRERATVLASGTLVEIARTNFARMRRGRLYLPQEGGGPATSDLEIALTRAFDSGDNEKIVDVTSKYLMGDQADIRAHLLRALALRKLGREKEANFHREVAIGLIESIVRTGDGRSFDTAWTVYRVKEEYEVLKASGYRVERQSLTSHGNRNFDVLDARKPQGGETFRAHFDITELFAEEGRAFLGR